ncbi:MAG: amino acid adenylation domain-containing protein [Rhodanobacter sp.]
MLRAESGGVQLPPLEKQPRGARIALSFAQERLWFLEQLGLVGSAYMVPEVLRFEGELQVEALRQSFQELMRRHESLRTRFASHEGTPFQIIDPSCRFELPVIGLSELAASAAQAELGRRSRMEVDIGFDLSKDPLLRATVLRLSDVEHVVLMTLHHIICDAWSRGILMQELNALYAAFAQGRPSPLPEPELHYADYALWQRSWLRGDLLQQQLEYWRRQLTDAPTLLQLPTDRPRPALANFNAVRLPFSLPEHLSRALQELAQREGVTLFMVLLAALQCLLSRWSGQKDIVVGSPIAGRIHRNTEALIGFFINVLVLRTRLLENLGFRELLARVKETTLEAYAHQDLPFDQLVADMQSQRDLSRHPLFQVDFTFENLPQQQFELPELRMTRMDSPSVTTHLDMALFMRESPTGLQGTIEYATELFDHATIGRLVEQYVYVLEQVAARPEARLSELQLLRAEERQRLLRDWNRTAVSYPASRCIHEAFAAQARKTPQADAIVFDGHLMSYAELDRRANQLARYLGTLGVGPEVVVGLYADRSFEMIVAILGVWKAGGAYLPLDPGAPAERLQFMLQDAGVSILLTQTVLEINLPVSWARVVQLDGHWSDIARQPTTPPGHQVTLENLAYVIYTSGSTGNPKGTLLQHGGLSNLAETQAADFGLGAGSRVLQFARSSFDASVWEIVMALRVGATLCLPKTTAAAPTFDLGRMLVDEQITAATLPPSVLASLSPSQPMSNFPALQLLVVAGEACPDELAQPWMEHCRFVNAYGPTEATVCATYAQCISGEFLSIGRPIANTGAYVLDEGLEPVPVGVAGELYIGGAGLARGYLNRPGLTAERFIADPFGNGERLYRTGDLVRYRADGKLEFIGRIDHQVKLRGYRIELGEIEATLLSHAGVKQAVVVVREDHPGDQQLVAYVAAQDADAAPLREHIKRHLPSYMCPTQWVIVEQLPLTPNGKVDRSALPAPQSDTESDAYQAPGTPVQEQLVEMWQEVLKRERIGIEDNFFELGGHSLLATRLVAQAREVLGVELPLRAIFEAPTVRGMSERVEMLRAESGGVQLPPLEKQPRGARIALSFAQERLWFLEQLGLVGSAYAVPATLRLEGVLQVEALRQSFEELMRRHESLRTRFESYEGTPFQIIDAGVHLPMQVRSVPHADEVQRRLDAHIHQGFDLARGPLARVLVLRVSEREHVLSMVLHHIVTDGWSIGILLRELGVLYTAFVQGEPIPLPEPALDYADYALWQRSWLQGSVLQRQLEYWRSQLADAPALLQLPTDHPRPAVPSFRGAVLRFGLSDELSGELRELARREGVTLFMLLLAAFKILLLRWSGQEDVVVGSLVAGRTHRATEGLTGLFLNTQALRTRLSGNLGFRAALARVKETTLDAHAHQDIPFEKLVAEFYLQRDLSRQPFFQTMFVLQNLPPQSLTLPGIRSTPLAGAHVTAKFDLTLSMQDTDAGLEGILEYAQDLFDAETVQNMAGHLRQLLESIVANPDSGILDLPLLTAAERAQLTQWNDTRQGHPPGCAHQLFAEQARRVPDALAVVAAGAQLTYAELEQRSNRLAHRLAALGVGPDSVVGIHAPRSVDMIVGWLAVLKAGGAYLSLDPSHPRERIAFMLQDARVRIVLVTEDAGAFPADVRTLRLDDTDEGLSDTPLPGDAVSVDHAAYVIYTSGSTGRPKGVVVRHGGLANLIAWHRRCFDIQSTDRASQLAANHFDASVWEVWPYLAAGAALHLVPRELAYDPAGLMGWMNAQGITVAFVPTPLAEQLFEWDGLHWGSLRAMLVGGDRLRAIPPALPFALINNYGPTEVTVVATSGCVESAAHSIAAVPSIGRPIDNTHCHVLDEQLRPVPVGVIGELYLGGAGLARGYLHQPGLTARRFIASPFTDATVAGGRLYRTGDRVRYRADGSLEFIGRTDAQVKVRGHRIEPGEIEAALLTYPALKQAMVIAHEEAPGQHQLVAYVTGEGLDPADLREHLVSRLPPYMIPVAFVALDTLPLNAQGKIDRAALPSPDWTRELRAGYSAPRTPVEHSLAAIWMQVLSLERVGIHDNFFKLGGDSIQSIKIIARAARAGLKLTLQHIFERQTIAGLAAVAQSNIVDAQQGVVKGEALLTPIQHWFFDTVSEKPQHFNQSFLLRADKPLSVPWLREAVATLLLQHDALRLRFTHDGHCWRQHHAAPQDSVPFEHIDLTGVVAPERFAALSRAAQTLQAGLDLAAGPLLRAALFELGEEYGQRLLLIVHHLAVDGVSWRILLEDLWTIYEQQQHGLSATLPAKTTSFQQWAQKLHTYAQEPQVQADAAYWREQPWQKSFPLPLDDPQGTNNVASAKTIAMALSEDETRQLLTLVPEAYRTQINDVLLTALAQAFATWTGSRSLLIDLEGHGREPLSDDVDVSRTVGWFTSLFPVLLELGDADDPGAALRGVQRQLQAVPRRGVSYGVLKYLSSTSLPPQTVPQVAFNYMGQFDQDIHDTGFKLAGEDRGESRSSSALRNHLIEVYGSVVHRRLQLNWEYSAELHKPSTMEAVAMEFMRCLRTLIEHCCSDDAEYALADFPLIDVLPASDEDRC